MSHPSKDENRESRANEGGGASEAQTHSLSISSHDMNEMYQALRRGAGFLGRSGRGLIVVGGSDRSDYLQGQLTNDILALGDGDGCYAVHLTPTGRIIADMDVLHIGGQIFLDVDKKVKDSLVSRFEELIFAEDVTISDCSESWSSYGVCGPNASRVVRLVLEEFGAQEQFLESKMELYKVARLSTVDFSIMFARTDFLGMPGFSLWVDSEGAESLQNVLIGKGAIGIDAEMADVVRIENGQPALQADLIDNVIPLEAGIEPRAISFTKGCYVGQEVIIRILHRGKGRVARRLTGLRIDSSELSSVPPGALLRSSEKEVGYLTSVALSPAIGSLVALGYVTREYLDLGSVLEVDTTSGRLRAVVTKLPFLS